MALYGILGDIHGNREALLAVLAALDHHPVDRLLCVGDVIGYNADSNECATILQQREILSIAGNHDLIGIGLLGLDRCSNIAMHALRRTRRVLRPDTVEYLRALPRALPIDDDLVLVHGGVRDVQQYVRSPQHVAENVQYLRADFPGRRICFYGHVHEQRLFEVEDDGSIRDLPAGGVVNLRPGREYFINPGSIDASRKEAPRLAEFALFDTGPMTVQFLSVPYDDALTEAKASAAGYRLGPWRNRLYELQRRIANLRRRISNLRRWPA